VLADRPAPRLLQGQSEQQVSRGSQDHKVNLESDLELLELWEVLDLQELQVQRVQLDNLEDPAPPDH